ncbi:hypothetical protein BY458DRAFT_517131 [Sporodiniella umbellata]|nr:hypothetical protein BY458DRAFT_517131 [Sporodiniella umbellata]
MKSMNRSWSKKSQKNNASRRREMTAKVTEEESIGQMARTFRRRLTMAHRKCQGLTASAVSTADWPIKKPGLKNLQLLKQYLTFVSYEAEERSSNSSSSAAGQGAQWIERWMMNGERKKGNRSPQAAALTDKVGMEVATERRRPGRPPKPKMFFDEEQALLMQRQKGRQKKKDVIQCVCDTPQDEFGGMVQCDDCLVWLHVDCLALDEEALADSYRCPPCCVTLGPAVQPAPMTRSMTWRYEAQLKSQHLASQETSDEEEDEEEDEEDLKDAWSDVASESRYSSCSTSEVSTPKEQLYVNDSIDYSPVVIDPESFELLSRLAYLQKLKDDLFSPRATDVFLCETTKTPHHPLSSLSDQPLPVIESLPSTLCSQELSEFSFDNGPFWQPLN